MSEIIMEGITATVIGMGMVFGVLAILCIILSFFKYLTPQEAPKPPVAQKPEPIDEYMPADEETEEAFDDSELVAVLSAAIAAHMGEGAPPIAIKSIKPVGGTYRAWNVSAIRENHRGLY